MLYLFQALACIFGLMEIVWVETYGEDTPVCFIVLLVVDRYSVYNCHFITPFESHLGGCILLRTLDRSLCQALWDHQRLYLSICRILNDYACYSVDRCSSMYPHHRSQLIRRDEWMWISLVLFVDLTWCVHRSQVVMWVFNTSYFISILCIFTWSKLLLIYKGWGKKKRLRIVTGKHNHVKIGRAHV